MNGLLDTLCSSLILCVVSLFFVLKPHCTSTMPYDFKRSPNALRKSPNTDKGKSKGKPGNEMLRVVVLFPVIPCE